MNAQDEVLATPLHYASYYGHVEVVEFLLANGADVSIKNKDELLAMDCALDNRVVRLFREFRNARDSYSRTVIGDIVLSNSRTDHVLRLLQQTKLHASVSEEVKTSSPERRP